jgi:two-component system, NarL family, response regulator NreC
MQNGKIKLLVADEQSILRHGLRRILEAEADMILVGEAANGADAVKKARQLKPEVVIMDISMPEQDGLESMRQIVKTVNARVIILSAHLEQHRISEAVSSGASGYLSKDCLDHELVSAVRTVMHGGTVFSPVVSKLLADYSMSGGGASRSLEALTTREREVFFMLAEGKSPTEVATGLFVSPKTVHTHRQHILEKLRLRTTTELIRFALRQGLIKTV